MVGGLMSGLSVAAASLANSIIYLYFLIGIVGGKGCDRLAANTATNLERARSFWGVLSADRCVFSEDVEHLPHLLRSFWRPRRVRTRVVIKADWSLILASVVFCGLPFFLPQAPVVILTRGSLTCIGLPGRINGPSQQLLVSPWPGDRHPAASLLSFG